MTGATLALVISAVASALAPTERMPDLWYARPANNWNEALPVGNGRLGAMVFGGTARERIQLNEASVWEGHADDRNAPEAAASFRAARELALAGKVVEAQRILQRDCMLPGNMLPRSHQTLGDLWIELVDAGTTAGAGGGAATAHGATDAPPDGYRRSLDLRTGVATTAMMLGDARIEREVFASAPDELLVVRVQAPGGTLPALRVRLRRETFESDVPVHAAIPGTSAARLSFAGRTGQGGVRYACTASVMADGGTVAVCGRNDQGLVRALEA
ncbi:MAG: glycoside hydrolase N-terminal domain-containing protein, partial [Phycisphaerales bacterium]